MVDENADTVTPLDGDGSNATGLDSQFTAPDPETSEPEDKGTDGQVTVATRRGYAFQPSFENAPLITSEGVQLDLGTAQAVVEESDKNDGGAFIVEPNKTEEV